MATILFGGSFDPLHNGHLAMLRAAKDFLPQAQLLVIPAACSPFKQNRQTAPEHHRLAMCRLAVEAQPDTLVSDVEFTMKKPSYTVRTVEKLKKAQPDDYYFLCGADSFLSLPRWKEYETLLTLVTFLVADRDGGEPHLILEQKRKIEMSGGKAVILDMPRVDVSSTKIREKIRCGMSLYGLVPPAVERYIQENNLYRE